jgi:hypothetical protein
MQMVVAGKRGVEFDDQIHVWEIETTGRDIGG